MRSRIYSKLAWTNICRNRKTYLPYMVSAIGMVMMFFLTINLSMDPQVATFEEGNWMHLGKRALYSFGNSHSIAIYGI